MADQTAKADQPLSVLSERFNDLRTLKGHYNGGEFNAAIDKPQSELHQVMMDLGKKLGVPNTPATEVVQYLGKPDDVMPSDPNVALMPGPVIPSSGQKVDSALQSSPYYLVYHWRGKHDYLYFEIDPVKETVITSKWYQALE